MDQIVLRRLIDELATRLRDVRIGSVYALPRYHLALPVALPSSPRLWFSAEPEEPHLYLRAGGHASPERPPGFAMAVRKRCRGRRIERLRMLDEDRVVELTWHGDAGRLVFELVPRRACAYLLDKEDLVVSVWNPRRGRPGPGTRYAAPHAGERPPPATLTPAKWRTLDDEPAGARVRALVRSIDGVSRLVAREAIAGAAEKPLAEAVQTALAHAEDAETSARIYSVAPLAALRQLPGPSKLILAPYRLRAADDMCELSFDSLSDAADHYYALRARLRFVDSLRSGLRARLRERRGRIERALARIQPPVGDDDSADRLRREGDLLLAHPDAVVTGDRVRLPDDYGDGQLIELRVDPALDGVGNAQRCYARARRLERKREADARRRRQLEAEQTRLEALDRQADSVATLEECDRLVVAAEHLGIALHGDRLREPEAGAALEGTEPKARTRGRRMPAGILAVRLPGGGEVLVGRNARANDRLTHELARRHDWWLHAEGPGSHVLLRNPSRAETPSRDALAGAAALAAWFSKSRTATHVEVRWTQARHVRRAPGGRPGAALLDEYRSIRVRPRSPGDVSGTRA